MESNSDEAEHEKRTSENATRSEKNFSNSVNTKAESGSKVEYRDSRLTGAPTARKGDSLEDETNYLSEKLKGAYNDVKLPNVPWMDEQNLQLGTYYVDLQLHTQQRSISIEEIFNDDTSSMQGAKKPKRILISSPPGYGKTTLAHKIIYDWASQEKEYVRRFKLAFLIKLRNLEKNLLSELTDIAESCGFENKDTVSKLVSTNATSTLLILDGLDELKPRERINVYKVLFGSELSNVTVVTTCRTGGYTITQKEQDILFNGVEKSTEFHDRKITIKGLNAYNREKLLGMIVPSPDKDKLTNRIRKIIDNTNNYRQSYYEERELFQCPLFVIFLAFIMQEKSDVVIETKTDLYKCVIDCLISHSCCKNGTLLPSDFTVFGTQKSWNSYRKIVNEFGKLSSEVLADKDGRLHFDCKENTNVLYEMGFLIKPCSTDKLSKRYYYEVFHSTVMEFVSAYHMWLEYKKNNSAFKKETICEIITRYFNYSSSSLTLPFLCGLLGDELSKLVNMLIPYSINFLKTYSKARYFADCKSSTNFPDKMCLLFPKVINHSDWLVRMQLFNKLLPWKTLKFSYGITGRNFVNLSQSVAVNCLQIEINSRCNFDVPIEFNFSNIRCKKLKFSVRSDAKNVEMWLQIFNSITATETKKLLFPDDCHFLASPKINDLLETATKNSPVNSQIVLATNSVRYITNYANLRKVVVKSCTQSKAIPENISTISASANLQIVCIYNYEHDLDISLLTNFGKKRWERVSLENVKTINCSSDLTNYKCIASFRNINCVNSPAVFGSIVPDLLRCDDGYITEAFKSSSFLARWPSVKELILEIGDITNYTEIMCCLTSLCRTHKPTIRLQLRLSEHSRSWLKFVNETDCAGTCNEYAVIAFLKSIYVTELYCDYYQILCYHSKTCLFKSIVRTVREKQIRVNTIIFDYYEECIADVCVCLSGRYVVKFIVILDPKNLPDVHVVSQFDFQRFKIEYGVVRDFSAKVFRFFNKDADCICISLK